MAQAIVIKVKAESASLVELDELMPFQGAFKRLTDANYKRLRAQLLNVGITAAFTIWKAKGKLWILDGHQRHDALKRMRAEGMTVPKVPVTWTTCKNEEEARAYVMALASTYGDVDKDELDDFAKGAGFELKDLDAQFRFPDIDLSELSALIMKPTRSDQAVDLDPKFEHKCPRCNYEF